MKSFVTKLLLLGALLIPSAMADNVLSINPGSQNTTVGGIVTFDVDIDAFIDLTGFQFDLLFDPLSLALNPLSPPSSLGVFSPSFSLFTVDDSIPGVVTVAEALFGPTGITSASPLGLVSFSFKALTPGVTNLSIDNIQLLDSVGPMLPGTPVGGSITVAPPSAVPEPSTYLLSAGALVGLWMLKRRG